MSGRESSLACLNNLFNILKTKISLHNCIFQSNRNARWEKMASAHKNLQHAKNISDKKEKYNFFMFENNVGKNLR